MIIKRIKLKNFFTFAEGDVKLGEGSFLITGENRDDVSANSNGSGKSLFCQSIVWCLFDDILRKGVKKDDVIGVNGEYTEVTVEIENDGETIEITRYRSHPTKNDKVDIYKDGELYSVHKDSQTRIEALLGVNAKTVYYCAYSDIQQPSLVSLTPAKLKAIVSEILETDRYEAYLKDVRKRVKTLTVEHTKKEGALVTLAEQLEIHKKELRLEKKSLESFEATKQKDIEKLQDESTKMRKEKASFEKNLEGTDIIHEEYMKLAEKMDNIDALNVSLKTAQQKVDKWKKKVDSKVNILVKIKVNIKKNAQSRDNLMDNEEGVCQYCAQALSFSGEADALVDKFCREDDRLQAEFIDHNVTLQNFKKTLTEAIAKRDDYKAQTLEFQETVKKFKRLGSGMTKIERMEASVESTDRMLTTLDKRISNLKNSKPDDSAVKRKQRIVSDTVKKYDIMMKSQEDRSANIKTHNNLIKELQDVKTSVFNQFIYTLKDSIEENLVEMTDGDYHCDVDSKKNELSFLFTQESKDYKYLPYSLFSTGERVRIQKAVSTALEEILQIGFVVDDEGLAGVDDSGIQAVLEFVLRKNEGKTFLFVGHQKSLKDAFIGGKNIHVTKEDGISSVEVLDI